MKSEFLVVVLFSVCALAQNNDPSQRYPQGQNVHHQQPTNLYNQHGQVTHNTPARNSRPAAADQQAPPENMPLPQIQGTVTEDRAQGTVPRGRGTVSQQKNANKFIRNENQSIENEDDIDEDNESRSHLIRPKMPWQKKSQKFHVPIKFDPNENFNAQSQKYITKQLKAAGKKLHVVFKAHQHETYVLKISTFAMCVNNYIHRVPTEPDVVVLCLDPDTPLLYNEIERAVKIGLRINDAVRKELHITDADDALNNEAEQDEEQDDAEGGEEEQEEDEEENEQNDEDDQSEDDE